MDDSEERHADSASAVQQHRHSGTQAAAAAVRHAQGTISTQKQSLDVSHSCGYVRDAKLFPFMWLLHLIVATPYVICTFTIPIAIYSDDGIKCRETPGYDVAMLPLKPVYFLHAALFLIYVIMMLSVTYCGPGPRAPTSRSLLHVKLEPNVASQRQYAFLQCGHLCICLHCLQRHSTPCGLTGATQMSSL